jgi:putative molybdopterin biosynthesis protein
LGGIIAIKRGHTHLAGTHLLDEVSGEYNLPAVQKYLEDMPVEIITFAHREQGIMIPNGNPKHIESIEDLSRVRFVNRQRGSGTRQLLDYQLSQRKILPENIDGYGREEYTHLAVATAVRSNSADCGLGVRSAAAALELDFISIGWERYDLVIPKVHRSNHIMENLLATLNSPSFQQELANQPGYSTKETGHLQVEVKP